MQTNMALRHASCSDFVRLGRPLAAPIQSSTSCARQQARPTALRATSASDNSATSTAEAAPADGTFFYQGKSFTKEEWDAAVASGQLAEPASVKDEYVKNNSAPAFSELMNFDGWAPERTNGRLAMIGVIAAVAAELSSGKSVISQLRIEPTFITLTLVIFMAASLVPLARNVDPEESEGIFTPRAEIINGRAAMLGFASLLVIEAVKGTALFGQ